MQVRVGPALERIGITGLHVRIVALPVDLLEALPGVLLGEESLNRLNRLHVRIAVIEIPIRERQVHGLVQRVDVARAVVAHGLEVHVLQNVEGLQQHGTLHPARELVDLDPLVVGHHRFLGVDLPVREILQRVETTLFL